VKLCAAGGVTSMVWDATLALTSIPRGTGYCLWHTPAPIDTSCAQYCLTTILHSTASLLPPLIGTWDDGVQTGVVVQGAITNLPCILYDQVTVRTTVYNFFMLTITSIASSRGRVFFDTNALLNYELSGLMVTNMLLGGYTDVRVTVTAHTNEGRGIFMNILPEPALAALLVVVPAARRALMCCRCAAMRYGSE
jgi:hypothetical protein